MFSNILDKDFKPAILEFRKFNEDVKKDPNRVHLIIAIERNHGYVYRKELDILSEGVDDERNTFMVERIIKSILWVVGGYKIFIAGSHKVYEDIKSYYRKGGLREFDYDFMSNVYENEVQVIECTYDNIPAEVSSSIPALGELKGRRIGFDAGGSDRKCSCPEEGVTAILPTTVTQLPEVLAPALKNVAKVVKEGYEGAEILGVHFEGPYLDMKYKGAQPPEAIAKPTIEEFKYYQECANGLIKYITIAPEHDEDFALIRYMSQNGVVVSMGHSSATYEQALLAIANGATSMTHVYNGMTPYHHRNLGLVGTSFRVRDIYGEVICDGCHSTFAALNNFFTTKGRDYSIMISDSLRPKGCSPDGEYTLGGHPIVIGEDGLARIKGTDTIAGSTLRINKGLKNLVEYAMVPFDVALNSCTINPARCLRVDDRKGRIKVGYDADMVVLDNDYNVIETYCRGKEMLNNK